MKKSRKNIDRLATARKQYYVVWFIGWLRFIEYMLVYI